MNHVDATLNQPSSTESDFSFIFWPIAMGMAFNLLSTAIGDPYPMAMAGLLVALAATILWRENSLAWTLFAAVVAANPANPSTTVAINLLCAAIFFVLMRSSGWTALPRLLHIAFFFVMLSMVISILASLPEELNVTTIHTTDISRPRPWMFTWTGGATIEILSNQIVSVTNYLLGPFLFIPLIFSRIRQGYKADRLLIGMVAGLIVPTLFLLLIARSFGQPILDANASVEGLINVSTYRLGKLIFIMTRTQVGIILAALICASFAVSISPVRWGTRLVALVCLIMAAYLLMVTGSVGSTISGLAGILVILLLGIRQFSVKRYFVMLFVGVGLIVATWAILPASIQNYTKTRYELRVGKSGSPTADRSWRWKKSFDYMLENPSGIGWSLYVEPLHTYPHNDYLSYGIAFGVLCGIIYFLFPTALLLSFISYNLMPRDPPRFTLSLAGAGVTTVLLINSFSDHLTANRWYFNVVWSLIWYAYFASRSTSFPSPSKTPSTNSTA